MKLLIIEDSERLRRSLVAGFTRLGYAIDESGDGKEGLEYALINQYDVIILDLMLPSLDGLSILKELRYHHVNSYVLILSAKDHVDDRVAGLNFGADDYLIKPFSFDELQARLLTLTRRKHGVKSPFINLGNVVIDTVMRNISVSDCVIKFTPIEYLIIEYLALNLNRVMTYDQMLDHLYTNEDVVSRNTLEAHVSSVRKKLKNVSVSDFLKTKRGFGYYIEKK